MAPPSKPGSALTSEPARDAFVDELEAAWASLSPEDRASLAAEARTAEERLRAHVSAGGDPDDFDPSA